MMGCSLPLRCSLQAGSFQGATTASSFPAWQAAGVPMGNIMTGECQCATLQGAEAAPRGLIHTHIEPECCCHMLVCPIWAMSDKTAPLR